MNLKNPNVQVALIGLAGAIIVSFMATPYVMEHLDNQPPILSDLTPSRDTPQYAFSVISWSANASDSDDDIVYYSFWLKGPSTKFKNTDMSGWTKSNKWNWTTSDLDVGVSIITVQVKDLQHPNENHQLEREYQIKYSDISQILQQCYLLSKYNKIDEAINCCKHCIDANQNDTFAWILNAGFLRQKGKNAEALQAYNQAIKIDPLYKDAWGRKADLLYFIKDYEGAINAYDYVIGIDSSDRAAFCNKGSALYMLKKYNDSINAYDGCLGINPCHTNCLEGKRMALKAIGKYDEANATFSRCQELAAK